MTLRPAGENSTSYVSTYTDENTIKMGWENWIKGAALNKGIRTSHDSTNFCNNPTALTGTAVEKLLKFVEQSEDD